MWIDQTVLRALIAKWRHRAAAGVQYISLGESSSITELLDELEPALASLLGGRPERGFVIDTETGTRWREIGRRDIAGDVWVDLALEDGDKLARSVKLALFERIFADPQTAPAAPEREK